jgi:hypothetical protein
MCLISWLSFCAVRFLCFFAYVLMTYVTYGILKSLCKVTFDMYQEVMASFLNVLDLKMAVMSALRTGRPLLPRNINFLLV